jgi:glycosyltransferase involved in cell wall biosynthesis
LPDVKVLVLTPALYDTAPGQRFRIEQWARHLEDDGFQFTFAPFEDDRLHRVIYTRGQFHRKATLMLRALLRRLKVLSAVGKHDLVFLVREAAMIGPAVVERIVPKLGVPVVYDFDDPIWLPYRSPNNGPFSRLRWPGKTATICRLASRVVVGNRLLADWARRHAPHVSVVPSTIDLAQYPLKPPPPNGRPVTLGWTGSHSTLPFLKLLHGSLEKLATRHSFRLLVISHSDSYRVDSASFEVVSKRWNSASEVVDLHQIDIGLGPFPNTGWTPWRCHGKVLQYMAAGIPCVASRVGVLPEYIQDGLNGFLATSQGEWIEKLTLLMENAGLRRRIGLAGRRTVEQRYSVNVWLPKLREILESAADMRR